MRYTVRKRTNYCGIRKPLEKTSQLALGVKQRQIPRRGIIEKKIDGVLG